MPLKISLRKAGILAKDETAPGVIVSDVIDDAAVQAFIQALAKHRHFERESLMLMA